MRFYIDGDEINVEDPAFFIDEDKYFELAETLREITGRDNHWYENVR